MMMMIFRSLDLSPPNEKQLREEGTRCGTRIRRFWAASVPQVNAVLCCFHFGFLRPIRKVRGPSLHEMEWCNLHFLRPSYNSMSLGAFLGVPQRDAHSCVICRLHTFSKIFARAFRALPGQLPFRRRAAFCHTVPITGNKCRTVPWDFFSKCS